MGKDLERLALLDFEIDGGRTLDRNHWCRIAAENGRVAVAASADTPAEATRLCVEKLKLLGIVLDSQSQKHIAMAVRLRIFGV